MITVRRLRELLATLPDDARAYAYEGEDVGIGVRFPDGRYFWIRAREDGAEDTYTAGPEL